jgi:hypothetical protein
MPSDFIGQQDAGTTGGNEFATMEILRKIPEILDAVLRSRPQRRATSIRRLISPEYGMTIAEPYQRLHTAGYSSRCLPG